VNAWEKTLGIHFEKFIPKDRFTRNVGELVGGTAIAQGLIILSSPLLTRLYTPSDFGVLAVFMSIIGLFQLVTSFRYEQAIPLPGDEKNASALMVLCFITHSGMTLIIGLGIGLIGIDLINWTNTKTLEAYIWLLPLGLFPVGIYEILSLWAIRTKEFSSLARTKISQGIGLVTTQIGLGYTPAGTLGLILGDIAGRCLGIWTLTRLLWQRSKTVVFRVTFNDLVNVLKRYRRFPLFSTPSVFFNRSGISLPPLLFSAFYGPTIAGWMVLCERVLRTPVSLLGQSTAKVYLGEAATLKRDDPERLFLLFCVTTKRLLLVGVLPIIIVVVFGPWLFGLVFGREWLQSGVYARFLGLSLLLEFVVSPLSQTLNILERQDLQLIWDILYFTLVVGSLLLSYWIGFSVKVAVAFYAGALFLAYFVQMIILWKILQRFAQKKNRN